MGSDGGDGCGDGCGDGWGDYDEHCRECRAGRAHCHGTLLRHSTQHWQCTDPDCTHPELVLHALVLDCDAVGCSCAEVAGHSVAV